MPNYSPIMRPPATTQTGKEKSLQSETVHLKVLGIDYFIDKIQYKYNSARGHSLQFYAYN